MIYVYILHFAPVILINLVSAPLHACTELRYHSFSISAPRILGSARQRQPGNFTSRDGEPIMNQFNPSTSRNAAILYVIILWNTVFYRVCSLLLINTQVPNEINFFYIWLSAYIFCEIELVQFFKEYNLTYCFLYVFALGFWAQLLKRNHSRKLSS